MTIGLDATYSIGKELSGVGVYSREILLGLARAHAETRFGFYYRPHRYLRSWQARLPANVARNLLVEFPGAIRVDLFHGLNQRLPAVRMRRTVATFHDLFVLTSNYSTAEFRARFAAQAREAAERADALIAVSAFTKSQMTALLDVDPGKIHVVHHGVHPLIFPNVERENIVLCVGAIQTRKNVERLVEAFEALDSSWRLVLAGSTGYGFDSIRMRIVTSKARQRIQVTGYLTGHQLQEWYARASIFAFPSLDEGFGIPVLEAMASDVPVLTSNRSALPEVAGDAALLVDPERTDAIANGLLRLASDHDLRTRLIERGRCRIRHFSWENAVKQTWEVYRLLLD